MKNLVYYVYKMFTCAFIYVTMYTEPYRYNKEINRMIRDKIIEMLKQKSIREQHKVTKLRWQKAELERLIDQKKNRQQK